MKTPSTTLGTIGEELAFQFLRSRGYKILLRNYTSALGEIDLVAKEDGMLVFVEVKTRTSESMGAPAESVTRRKRRQITRSAQAYLKRYGLPDASCRFDVVSVLMRLGQNPLIEIIQNAFNEGE